MCELLPWDLRKGFLTRNWKKLGMENREMQERHTEESPVECDAKQKLDRWDWVALALLLALAAGVWLWFALSTRLALEDAYITFRYARNIAQGVGFVFNPGELVLGTTTPLQTLLLAALGRLFGPERIPLIAEILMPCFGLAALVTM
jgi:hypothetical protein